MGRRRPAAAAVVALVLFGAGLGGLSAPPALGHGSSPECYGEIVVEDVRSGAPTECIFHFTGLPILVEGYFSTDHPQLKADIHVVVTAVLRDGERQELPIECTDLGRANDPRAECRAEWNPAGTGRQPSEVPMLHDVAYLFCEAHTHSRESRLYDRYFGEGAGGEFRCASAPYDAGPGEPGQGVAIPTLPASAPAFVTVPVNRYATSQTVVVRAVAAKNPPTYTNADLDLHDVVALDEKRPAGSAPWCFQYEPGACPLFWSRLIGIGESTPVLGFDSTPPGTYRFYCSIHPEMIGSVIVQ